MRSWRLTLILISALAPLACAGAMAATAVASPVCPQAVLFDATFTADRTAGPDANHVGHQQLASGVLGNSTGHRVGRFAFTCIWTRILAGGDALERCAGFGRTADGRLDVAGPARESEAVHHWRLTGEGGVYRGADGTALVRDIGSRESLITAMVTPRAGTVLRVAVIVRPAADGSLVAHADQICTHASRQLAALPPFRLPDFDPMHPDPRQLPLLGAFFISPGDPRPIFQALNTRLRALGQTPARRGWWARMLHARGAELTVINEQDRAALAADAPAFVQSVRDSVTAFRQIAITAAVFGTTHACSEHRTPVAGAATRCRDGERRCSRAPAHLGPRRSVPHAADQVRRHPRRTDHRRRGT
jgi:hypothetical protein